MATTSAGFLRTPGDGPIAHPVSEPALPVSSAHAGRPSTCSYASAKVQRGLRPAMPRASPQLLSGPAPAIVNKCRRCWHDHQQCNRRGRCGRVRNRQGRTNHTTKGAASGPHVQMTCVKPSGISVLCLHLGAVGHHASCRILRTVVAERPTMAATLRCGSPWAASSFTCSAWAGL